MEWIILLAIGFAAGSLGALAGIGGGIIIVPSLLFLARRLHGSLRFLRSRRSEYRLSS